MRSTLMPLARAKTGFDPTAVIAVPVFVWRKAQMMKAKKAKKATSVGMTRCLVNWIDRVVEDMG